jgi:L-alanine-DL-glutamate epimerase-like enolase superfamily enzyme
VLVNPRPLTEAEASVFTEVVKAIREQRIRGDAVKAMEQPRAIRPAMSLYVKGLGWVELKGRQ